MRTLTQDEQEMIGELADLAEHGTPASLVDNPTTQIGTPETHARMTQVLLDATADPDSDPRVVAGIHQALRGRHSIGLPGPQGASPVWNLRVSNDLNQRTRQAAKANGQSLSEIVRQAVTEYLDRHAA
jgi:hypothetical protein